MYFFFFFKQKTAYEVRISDWSSDVCSSDLSHHRCRRRYRLRARHHREARRPRSARQSRSRPADAAGRDRRRLLESFQPAAGRLDLRAGNPSIWGNLVMTTTHIEYLFDRSEENTSELQSLMRISYAVFCLNNKIVIYHVYNVETNTSPQFQ